MEIQLPEKFSFDPLFQKKILKLMYLKPSILVKVDKYCKKEYFTGEPLQWFYQTMVDYYHKYHSQLTETAITEEIKKEQIRRSIKTKEQTSILFEFISVVREIHQLKIEEEAYIISELEQWIKDRLFAEGWIKARDVFNAQGNSIKAFEIADDVISKIRQVRFEESNRSYFFRDVEKRQEMREERKNSGSYRITTGVIELDCLLGGGTTKGELAIVAADSNKGKSIFCVNVGAACVADGLKVAHFNLEGKENQIQDRYEARLLLEDYGKVLNNECSPDKFDRYRYFGDNLVIVELSKNFKKTIDDITDELDKLKIEGFIPDVVIIDYADLLRPKFVSKENMFLSGEEIFGDLKTLANQGYAVWSPTQCHRINEKIGDPANDPEFVYRRATLGGSYDKLAKADLLITLNRTDEEERNNLMRIYLDKYRDKQRGHLIKIKTNYPMMQMELPTHSTYDKLNKFLYPELFKK